MLVWMDLEMTGLIPSRDVVVEIATIITDDELNVVAEGPDLAINATDEQLAGMDEVVLNMHTRSGLQRSRAQRLARAGWRRLPVWRQVESGAQGSGGCPWSAQICDRQRG